MSPGTKCNFNLTSGRTISLHVILAFNGGCRMLTNRVLWAKVLSSLTDGQERRVYVHVMWNNMCKITGVCWTK